MFPSLLFTIFGGLSASAIFQPLRSHRRIYISAIATFSALTLVLYQLFGTPQIISALHQYAQQNREARQVIISESEKLKKDPKDLESWMRLGQAFAQTHHWAEASRAFKQSVLLSAGEPELIMAYARSLIMENSGHVDDHAKRSLEMVLLQKPNHTEARYYMAVRTLQEGKNEQAMQQMKALYKELPENSPVKQMIDQQIGR